MMKLYLFSRVVLFVELHINLSILIKGLEYFCGLKQYNRGVESVWLYKIDQFKGRISHSLGYNNCICKKEQEIAAEIFEIPACNKK